MGSADEELEKNYQDALTSAAVMQQALALWLKAEKEGDKDKQKLNFRIFYILRHEVEQKGFPVDVVVTKFFSHQSPNFFKNYTVVVGVTVHKPPKNGTPEERDAYDRWYKKTIGIADDPPPEPPKDQ